MAGSFSDWTENKVLDFVFGGVAWTPPATYYLALFTAAPSDSGGGTEVTIGSNGYVRLAVTKNQTNFPASSGGAISNGVVLTMATPTGSGWGTVVAYALYDASTAGNLVGWADLAANKTIDAGDPVTFEIGDLDITLT